MSHADSEPAAGPSAARSLLPVLLDVAPPLIAYYGLRALGASEYAALLTATLVSGVKVAHDAIRMRRLDPFAGYLLLTFGLSLAVALITTDPKLILAGNTLVNGLGGLMFLGSCVVGTPLTQVVAERARPGTPATPSADEGAADTPEEAAYRRRVHVRLSAMWGVGLLAEVAVRLAVIARTSVDVANGVTSVVSWTFLGALMVATVVIAKSARTRWEQSGTARG